MTLTPEPLSHRRVTPHLRVDEAHSNGLNQIFYPIP